MLTLTGMLVEAEAKKRALQEIAKAPKAIEALNTILDLGYDISVEYHDDDQGKIMAMPITRADLEAMSQE
jgi:ribulose bisphosphate carboxylase small subunit